MSDHSSPLSVERHPQLRRLEPPVKDARVPEIRQEAAIESFAACLTSILLHHEVRSTIDQVYGVIQRQLDPMSDEGILAAARQLGLRGRRITLPLKQVLFVPRGALLRWQRGELVVFDSQEHGKIHIMHPEHGRQALTLSEFSELFQGVCFEFDTLPAVGGRLETTWKAIIGMILRNRKSVAAIMIASVLIQALALAVPLLVALVVDEIAPRQDADLLLLVAIGMGILVVFRGLSGLARHYALLGLQTRMSQELSLDFLNHLTDLPYSFFEEHSRGDLLVRADANDQIRDFAAGGALTIFVDGALAIFYVVMLLVASAELGGIMLGIAAIQLGSLYWIRRRLIPVIDKLFDARGNSSSILLETISSLQTIKLLAAEKQAISRWLERYSAELQLNLKANRIEARADSIAQSLVSLTPLAMLVFGAFLVLDGSISVGEMLALGALALGFIMQFTKGVETFLELQVLSTVVRKLDEVRTHAPEQDRHAVAPAPLLKGLIQLDRVSYQYSVTSQPVIRDVSLEIRPGEFVAIVGGSGAGKSTLASLLIGLRLPTSGRVLFDKIDLKTIDVRSVRQQIGIVPQAVFLLGGSTIRDNITLGHSRIGHAAAEEAAKSAQVHEDIMEMPMTYNTIVPSGGVGFSGGQQQRIAIARAIVHRPAILILDEATSALDTQTEQAIQENLKTMQCTRIVVAHRLSTIQDADRILVLEQGSIVEQGTHHELIARGGLYARMAAVGEN
tara:strand:- start:34766 stop:36964 length:2199 start_codon:yes stop_codon:yes gene_type:complete